MNIDISQLLTTLCIRFKEIALTNIPDRNDKELVRKILLANGIMSVGIGVSSILSCVSFIEGDAIQGGLDLLVALLFYVLLCLMRFRQWYRRSFLICTVVMYCFFFFLFVTGAVHGNAFMWYYVCPLFALFFFGARNGALATMLLFLPTLIFLAIDISFADTPLYGKHFIGRFVPSFITVFILSYLFERSREQVYKELLSVHAHQEEIIEERTEKMKKQQAQMAHSGRLTALGEMATGIAHEINQPLTIISLAEQHLKRKWAKDSRHDSGVEASLAKIAIQVKRASTIIHNMRSFAHSSEKAMIETDISEPVTTALSFFQEQFRIHQIAIKTSFAPHLPKVLLDSQKMEQVVVNLLSNARLALKKRKEMAGNGYEQHVHIRLFADKNGTDVVLEVEDNGIGMSPEVLAHCQEPFFTTRSVGQGTGLGLSILNNIVTEFNGVVQIESISGRGSTFRILLPGESHGQQ